jgi:hypothetical protein
MTVIILSKLIKLFLISDLPSYNIQYDSLIEMLIWNIIKLNSTCYKISLISICFSVHVYKFTRGKCHFDKIHNYKFIGQMLHTENRHRKLRTPSLACSSSLFHSPKLHKLYLHWKSLLLNPVFREQANHHFWIGVHL